MSGEANNEKTNRSMKYKHDTKRIDFDHNE